MRATVPPSTGKRTDPPEGVMDAGVGLVEAGHSDVVIGGSRRSHERGL